MSKFKPRPTYAPAGALPIVAAKLATVAAKALATETPAVLAMTALAPSQKGATATPLTSPTELAAPENDPRDDPARLASFLTLRNPANPLAVASVLRGQPLPASTDLTPILGASVRQLLTDPNSVLYRDTAVLAVEHAVIPSGLTIAAAGAVFDKAAPVLAPATLKSALDSLPLIPVKEGSVYKPVPPTPRLAAPPSASDGTPVPRSTTLSALIAGGVDCVAWNAMTDVARRNTLVNFGLAADALSANALAQLVNAECGAVMATSGSGPGQVLRPPQPQVGMTAGQAALNALYDHSDVTRVYSCEVWGNLSPQAKRDALRAAGLVPAPMVPIPGGSDLVADAIAADVTYECMRSSNDWRTFLRYAQSPSDDPSRSLHSCAGFLSASRAAQEEAFARRGWRTVDIPDGIARLQAWCAQTSTLTSAIESLCTTTNWRVRTDLLAATRRTMRPLTLEVSPHYRNNPNLRPLLESEWEQGRSDDLAIPSLPVLAQDVFDRCDGSNTGTSFTRDNPRFSSSRDYHHAWLSLGPVIPSGGFDALDPVQGCTGDCYLIAAMTAIVWSRPGLLERIVQRLGPGPQGTTRYRVTIRGEAQDIDDTFVMSPFWFVPMYASSIRQDAWWPALIEKAYARWRVRGTTDRPNMEAASNSYEGSDAREDARQSISIFASTQFATFNLVGGTRFWWLTWFRSGEACWRKIRAYCDANGRAITPMIAVTGGDYDHSRPIVLTDLNLVPQHAYAVLGVTTDNSGLPLAVILRNPWGHTTPLASTLVPIPGGWNRLNVSGEYNGVFAMRVDAFASAFGWVYGTVL